MSRPLQVLALTRYGALGASSRLRFLDYVPALQVHNIHVHPQVLFDNAALTTRYARGGYGLALAARCFAGRVAALRQRGRFDVLWIEKEALPMWPLWLERGLLRGVPFVLDYDDAVFHNYDRHRLAAVRWLYGRRLDGLMARSHLVMAGNPYLAERAQAAGAQRVEPLPTVIDLQRYPRPSGRKPTENVPRIVWIGSPSTAQYLQLLHQPLQDLAAQQPFVLRVIGALVDLPGVPLELVDWAEDTEVADVAACDIGVMPLLDSPWERGKCGYKLIQYMACGLPVVASPVGVNGHIVQQGRNGFLADTAQAWVTALAKLLADAALRQQMGQAGRLRVEQEYCLQVTAPRLAGLLRGAVQ
ncbi:glycosyltransferase family 4 protein [Alicycliphilus denitrificans]|uniref:glycosyltransferase family 4 protein n=1 Tax=Alicycliphilus denitrificans TaxID=179636 RepID=UPI00384CAEA7